MDQSRELIFVLIFGTSIGKKVAKGFKMLPLTLKVRLYRYMEDLSNKVFAKKLWT